MLSRLDMRWRIALMLCVITTINYLDRQALSIAAPSLMDEFSLSNTQYGWITSAFLFTYALGQLLSGPIIDRLGTKRGFNLAVVVWSVAGMLHALGRGFVSFFCLRGLLGFGESANFPTALKAIAEWFPRAERSMAVGILTVGPGLGAVLSPPLLGVIIYTLGWRAAFIIPGLLGFVWVWWWQRMYHSPEAHPSLSHRELELILSGREDSTEGSVRPRLRDFLRYREVWGLMLSRFVSDGAFYFFVFWVPLYLASERGFNIIEIGLFAWIPFLAADVGSLAGGWSGQELIRRGMSVNAARKWVIWVGALMVPLALPAVMAESPVLAIALIGGAMFAIQFKASSLFTLPADLFPARDVATVWGLYGAVGSFGGMAFNAMVGWTIDHYSYLPVFATVAAMHIVSAVLVNVFIPRIELLPATASREE
jgi:ACS family hexuronate transporter-like MFS transporter